MGRTYYTRDIAAAAYLKLKGFTITIEKDNKNPKKGLFYYPEEANKDLVEFYNNSGDFQLFHGTFRSLKSQVINFPKTLIEKEVNISAS